MGVDVMGIDVIKSLELMFLGMVGIFVVMILIYIVIGLLNNVTKDTDKKDHSDAGSKEKEQAEAVPAVDNSEDELVCAIIEAAICEELHTEPDKLKIIEINEK